MARSLAELCGPCMVGALSGRGKSLRHREHWRTFEEVGRMKHWVFAAAAMLGATPAQAVTVVTADRMLDVTNGRYVDHPAILIGDDGKIQQVGSAGSVQAPAGAKHIDLSGETLVP